MKRSYEEEFDDIDDTILLQTLVAQEPFLMQESSDAISQKQTTDYQLQLKLLEAELQAKTGEISLIRQTLSQKQTENTQLRAQLVKQNQVKEDYKDKKILMNEIDKLKTELLFQSQDVKTARPRTISKQNVAVNTYTLQAIDPKEIWIKSFLNLPFDACLVESHHHPLLSKSFSQTCEMVSSMSDPSCILFTFIEALDQSSKQGWSKCISVLSKGLKLVCQLSLKARRLFPPFSFMHLFQKESSIVSIVNYLLEFQPHLKQEIPSDIHFHSPDYKLAVEGLLETCPDLLTVDLICKLLESNVTKQTWAVLYKARKLCGSPRILESLIPFMDQADGLEFLYLVFSQGDVSCSHKTSQKIIAKLTRLYLCSQSCLVKDILTFMVPDPEEALAILL